MERQEGGGGRSQGVEARADEAVISLSGEQQLCLHGAFELRVIEGSAVLNGGYKCGPEQGPVPVWAPYTSPAATVARDPQSKRPDVVIAFSEQRGAIPCARYFVNPDEAPGVTASKRGRQRAAETPYGDPFGFRTLRVLSDPTRGAVLTVPREWHTLAAEVARASNAGPTCTVVCGGKGTGKSTLARLLVNALLEKHPEVAFLDCDPGQPELAPPGVVSLSLVRAPLLGVPFTHVRSPGVETITAVYVGEVSPAPVVGYYVQALRTLFRAFRRLGGERKEGDSEGRRSLPPPIVVNTCGWVLNMGRDVLLETVAMAAPDFVVQVTGPGGDILSSNDVAEALYGVADTLPKLRSLPSAARVGPPTALQLPASEARTAQLLAYFGDHACALAAAPAYAVPFAEVAVGFVCAKVAPSQAFYALNGTVVGLCHNDLPTKASGKPTADERKLPAFLADTPRPCTCFGLGIIKSIDAENRFFYIITPANLVKRTPLHFFSCFFFRKKRK